VEAEPPSLEYCSVAEWTMPLLSGSLSICSIFHTAPPHHAPRCGLQQEGCRLPPALTRAARRIGVGPAGLGWQRADATPEFLFAESPPRRDPLPAPLHLAGA